MRFIRSISKIIFIAVSFLAGLITIFGFIVTCIKWLQGEWQKRKVIAWLFDVYSFGLPTWAWIGLFLLIVILSMLVFWLITRKPKRDIYTDEEDIKNILELWFRKFSTNDRGRHKQKLTIKFSLCDQLNNLKSGSTEKFLPGIVEKSGIYEIKSKGRKTIVIVLKGILIQAGPNGPNGGYL
jgi:hypothetical protein